ncbi:hypothetical protein CYMTET_33945, partial [Cymbomonas tetramitiformis]
LGPALFVNCGAKRFGCQDAYTCLCQQNARVEEENKINLKVGVLQEMLLQIRWGVRWSLSKMIGRTRERQFLTNEEMLYLLTDHPLIAPKAYVLERVPTMSDPNPPPDTLITYELLCTAIRPQKATLLMMAIGTELTACPDEIIAYVEGQQLNTPRPSVNLSANQQGEANTEPKMPEGGDVANDVKQKNGLWSRAAQLPQQEQDQRAPHQEQQQRVFCLFEQNGHAVEIVDEDVYLGSSDSVEGIDTSEPHTPPRDTPPMNSEQEKEQSPLLPLAGSRSGEAAKCVYLLYYKSLKT